MRINKKATSIIIALVLLFSMITGESISAELYARSSTFVEKVPISIISVSKSSLYNDIHTSKLTTPDKEERQLLEPYKKNSTTNINLSPDIYYQKLYYSKNLPTPLKFQYIFEVREDPGDKIIRYIHDQDGEKDGAFL